LIEEERAGHDARLRVYRLRRERITALRQWLEQLETFWREQLDSFKEHAERTRKGPLRG